MGSIRQMVATAGGAVAVLALTASVASAAGTMSVDISRAGAVAGDGINCARAIGATSTTGVCAATFRDVRVCEEGPNGKPVCHFESRGASVTAGSPGDGFIFTGWSGDCAGQGAACVVDMDG